jgi:hypothetical protein
MKVKLAEALLRRKELGEKVLLLKNLDQKALYEVKAKRVKVTDDIDDLVASVPKLSAAEVLQEHDWHARQLRRVDAAIQQANWSTEIEVDAEVMQDFIVK